MSRIICSENYHHEYQCRFDDCERFYCAEHRLLWRFCDTARAVSEGDRDVIGGTRTVYEAGECPKCEGEAKRKRLYRQLCAQFKHESVCPECFEIAAQADETAIHLVDVHGMDAEVARVWLLGQVEEKAFYEKP